MNFQINDPLTQPTNNYHSTVIQQDTSPISTQQLFVYINFTFGFLILISIVCYWFTALKKIKSIDINKKIALDLLKDQIDYINKQKSFKTTINNDGSSTTIDVCKDFEYFKSETIQNISKAIVQITNH